jgi:hypothetical protein
MAPTYHTIRHRFQANPVVYRSDRCRYTLGWLRTEENFGLELSASVAAAMPQRVRELVGFKMHGGLGFFSNDIHDK